MFGDVHYTQKQGVLLIFYANPRKSRLIRVLFTICITLRNIIRRIEYDTKKEKKELLYEKLAELPEEDQDLYRLYFTEGYSQEEIAEMKGVS